MLEKALIDKYAFKNTVIVDVGPVIGTHVGAGMVALIFLQNDRRFDYIQRQRYGYQRR